MNSSDARKIVWLGNATLVIGVAALSFLVISNVQKPATKIAQYVAPNVVVNPEDVQRGKKSSVSLREINRVFGYKPPPPPKPKPKIVKRPPVVTNGPKKVKTEDPLSKQIELTMVFGRFAFILLKKDKAEKSFMVGDEIKDIAGSSIGRLDAIDHDSIDVRVKGKIHNLKIKGFEELEKLREEKAALMKKTSGSKIGLESAGSDKRAGLIAPTVGNPAKKIANAEDLLKAQEKINRKKEDRERRKKEQLEAEELRKAKIAQQKEDRNFKNSQQRAKQLEKIEAQNKDALENPIIMGGNEILIFERDQDADGTRNVTLSSSSIKKLNSTEMRRRFTSMNTWVLEFVQSGIVVHEVTDAEIKDLMGKYGFTKGTKITHLNDEFVGGKTEDDLTDIMSTMAGSKFVKVDYIQGGKKLKVRISQDILFKDSK